MVRTTMTATLNQVNSGLNNSNGRPNVESINSIAQRVKNEVYSIATERTAWGRTNLSIVALQAHVQSLVNNDANLNTKFVTAGISIATLDFSGTWLTDLTTAIMIMAQHERDEQKNAQKEFDRIYMSNTNTSFDSTPNEILSQINDAKVSGTWEGTYNFDGRWIQIRYTSVRGADKFDSMIQKKNWGLKPVSASTPGALLQKITSWNEKKEEKDTNIITVQSGVEIKTEIDPTQVFLALDFVDKNKKKNKGFYSFDDKLFGITYTWGQYKVEIQNEDSTVSVIDCADSVSTLNTIRTDAKKVKEKTNTLTMDMWNDFDENKFTEICKTIWTSKDKTGYYTIGWKKYSVKYFNTGDEIRAAYDKNPAVTASGNGYWAEYPHDVDKNDTGLQTMSGPELSNYLAKNIHLYHEHDDLDREILLWKMQKLKGRWYGKKKITYTIKGHKYHMWSKNTTWFWLKRKYYAEVPSWEHRKEIISAFTVEWLYEKIIDNIEWENNHHEKHEKGKKHEKEENEAKQALTENANESGSWSFGAALKTVALAPIRLFNKQPAWIRGAEIGLGYALYSGGAVLAGPAIMGGAVLGASWWGLKKLWRIKNPKKWGEDKENH